MIGDIWKLIAAQPFVRFPFHSADGKLGDSQKNGGVNSV